MNDEELALMVMYEKFIDWMRKAKQDKNDRARRDKLAEWAGLPKGSGFVMMALAFCAGADAAADFITTLEGKGKALPKETAAEPGPKRQNGEKKNPANGPKHRQGKGRP